MLSRSHFFQVKVKVVPVLRPFHLHPGINSSSSLETSQTSYLHCRGYPPSFHTTTHVKYLAITGCKFGCPGEDSHGFVQASRGEGLRSGHGNSEDLDGMSHDRISGGLVADPCASCMSVAYWYYVYLWYLRPIITNNYWNNFRFELGVRVGKEWSGYVRIVPLHDETAGETLSKQKAARKRWRQQIKRQSFARLLLWVLHGKMQWYQYNV